MDKRQLIERLMGTFLEELDEHVRDLNQALLALEEDPAATAAGEGTKALFRTVHSLKGAARSVNVHAIEAACHACETLLAGSRDADVRLTPALVEVLFATADALKDASQRLRARGDLAGTAIETLLPRLEAARGPSAARGRAATTPTPTPTTPPLLRAPPAPTAASSPMAATTPLTTAAPPADGVVRVAAERLDRLLAWSGELLLARRRVATRQDDVGSLKEQLAELRRDWTRLTDALASPRDGATSPLSSRSRATIHRARDGLKKLERGLESLESRMHEDLRVLEQTASPLEQEIRSVRLRPFGDACEGLDRMVRDLGRTAGKPIELHVEGAEVELDRAILDGLRDPLLHLVRNAVDHGIEAPAERIAAGKPSRGRVSVRASLRGGGLEVTVADDGRGLDLGAIRAQARRRRLDIPDDDREVARLIFTPGLSTAARLTELSGRGIGLDAVKHRIETLHGTVSCSFEPGAGTHFALSLPLTLSSLRVLLVAAAGQVYALPTVSVARLVRARPDELAVVHGREMLRLGGRPIPVSHLGDVLGVAAAPTSASRISLVVIAAGSHQVAIAVDELLTEQECVVKDLGPRLRRVRHVAGATLLPTGKVALILSASDLIESVLARVPERRLAAPPAPVAPRRRVLVADDSVTTRTLEKSILEAAGYEVATAPDGAAAWQLLQEQGADLLVADVEMPRMDGFALCEAIRGSRRFRDLPIVLVTALESESDKVRGLEAGADAYLAKGSFDQRQLLDTIAQLL